ncbi:IS1 family transposase [Klebsiella pneumoniae]
MSRFILGNCIDVMRGFPDRASVELHDKVIGHYLNIKHYQ